MARLIRAGFDTSTLNWLADTPSALAPVLTARDMGLLEVVVTPEAAAEIRRTPDAARRAQLESVLANFFPLTPTRLPRLGAFRLGRARLPTAEDEARLQAVGFLQDGPDRALVTNAAGYRCDVFVVRDDELTRRKKKRLEAELGGTRIVEPHAFVEEVRRLVDNCSGSELM